jgi:hypothetical protein
MYLLWKPCNPWRQGTLHVHSYCGNPMTQAGKAHTFTQSELTYHLITELLYGLDCSYKSFMFVHDTYGNNDITTCVVWCT